MRLTVIWVLYSLLSLGGCVQYSFFFFLTGIGDAFWFAKVPAMRFDG